VAAIVGVDHAQITIPSDADQIAREFYLEFLGLSEIAKPENLKARGGFWMDAGNLMVHVGVQDGIDRKGSKNHVAYRVDNLAAWRAKLAAREIEILEGLPIPGVERFEFRDPFGNRLEFLQPIDSPQR
jgi:catechol 2,3-dioxygenase-like lactoylglutathione lyase family enzyme